jgi:hypothetical protein
VPKMAGWLTVAQLLSFLGSLQKNRAKPKAGC